MVEELFEKAREFLQKKDLRKALKEFEKIIEIDPNSTEAWFAMGVVFGGLKKHKDAIECFEKTINLDPEHITAWHNLGVAYSAIKNYRSALDCHEKILTFAPNNHLAWFHKGCTLFLMRKWELAATALEKSVEIAPNPENLLMLGGICRVLGEKYRAKCYFQQAYELAPSQKEKKMVKKLVKRRHGVNL